MPASRPLFRDPVHNGAADPVVIWNHRARTWWMFYTNRRAKDLTIPEIAWVHGTRLGIAESADGGATWTYRGVAQIDLPAEFGPVETITHWAPELIHHEGVYHMYLTVVPGIFTDWNHPRALVHLTSPDLENWTYRSTLKLTSHRVIDACVVRLPSGKWRMWYNDEVADKAINLAESDDLFTWRDLGLVTLPGRRAGEGPKVFRLGDAWWMIVDEWRGEDDRGRGHHADVVVSEGRAWIFYFSPGEITVGVEPAPGANTRRTTIHVAELVLGADGWLSCDRDAPAHIRLAPPEA